MRVFSSANGALLVYWLARRAGAADPWRCLLVALASFCAIAAAFSLNDATDAQEDRVNNATRPVAAGKISVRAAIAVYIVLAVLALLSGIALRSTIGFLTVAAMISSVSLYSLKIKTLWAAKNILIAGTVSMLPILAWSTAPALSTPLRESIVAMLFLWALEKEVLGDIRDLAGDTGVGLKTLPRQIGRLPTALFVAGINVSMWCILLLVTQPPPVERWMLLAFAAIHTIAVTACAAVRNPLWVKTYLRIQVALTVTGLAVLIESARR
jgi:4-hydroxybenzoate polyprenyltransferase